MLSYTLLWQALAADVFVLSSLISVFFLKNAMDWKDLFHHKGRRVCHSLVRMQRNILIVHVNKPSRPSFRVEILSILYVLTRLRKL